LTKARQDAFLSEAFAREYLSHWTKHDALSNCA
jgi:hypothetical protein